MFPSTRSLMLAAALVLVVALPDSAVGAGVSNQDYARGIIDLAGWTETQGDVPGAPGTSPQVTGFQREELVPGIAHYTVDLRIGSGPYDNLRVHRVVEEKSPNSPKRTHDSIFLLHGDLFPFLKFIFGTATPYLPDDASIAVRLAQAGWDVWGIDQPWTLVPAEETDHSWAEGWGMRFNVDCLERGIDVARLVRRFTGNGFGKMKLLGYSSGGMTTYAFMNRQTQLPPGLRSVDGFVIADVMYKYDTSDAVLEAARQSDCAYGAYYRGVVDGGVYMEDLSLYSLFGELAFTAPDDPSPLIPGVTNLEAALLAFTVPAGDWLPWYHFFAPVYEGGNPLPQDTRFTPVGAMIDFTRRFVPWEPTTYFRDYYEIGCNELDVPWDDHLGEITAPMLLLSPRGGVGRAGFHTVGLLGSTDKTIAEFSFFPPDEVDFAHIDLWTAEDAPDLVWPTLIDWLDAHRGGHQAAPPQEAVAGQRQDVRITPNPGRGPFTFSFSLAQAGEAEVEIFDVLGRRVASLLSGPAAAGAHQVVWDGRNTTGRLISDGVYFARVRTTEGTSTSRFVHVSR